MNIRLIYAGFGFLLVTSMFGCNDGKDNEKGDLYMNSIYVSCQLRTKIDDQEDVIIEATFTNHSNSAICIEKRLLLMNEELDGAAFFSVRHGPTVVPYHGLLIKRRAPEPEDYYKLPPGEFISSNIRLRDFFDISVSGHYTISYAVAFTEPKTGTYLEVKSNTVKVDVKN